jgi:hypothetical protein
MTMDRDDRNREEILELRKITKQLQLENEGLKMERDGLKRALDKQNEMILRLRGEITEQATP